MIKVGARLTSLAVFIGGPYLAFFDGWALPGSGLALLCPASFRPDSAAY